CLYSVLKLAHESSQNVYANVGDMCPDLRRPGLVTFPFTVLTPSPGEKAVIMMLYGVTLVYNSGGGGGDGDGDNDDDDDDVDNDDDNENNTDEKITGN
ncbi:hypothetical protein RRG08_006856, partial [Elysia crispata]